MNEKSNREIIDFINVMYDEQIPRPIKFIVKRKAKNIEKLSLDDFPESFRSCTVEELIIILKDAYGKKLLNF